MNKNKAKKILSLLCDYYGEVKPALHYRNIYELSIAVVLSAQTTDRQVNSVTPRLFKKYPDYRSLAEAKKSDIEKIIRPTGFFRNKAGNINKLARKVTAEYSGILPATFEELITLPGIGRKSANVIISAGFGRPAFAVDTHVIRIANRLGFVSDKKPEKVEEAVTAVIPENSWIKAHLLFIHHGRRTCLAKKPLCAVCPVRGLCPSAASR